MSRSSAKKERIEALVMKLEVLRIQPAAHAGLLSPVG